MKSKNTKILRFYLENEKDGGSELSYKIKKDFGRKSENSGKKNVI